MRCLLPSLLVLAISVVGCSDTLEPFAEGDRHFAIFGFLDTDADTQFVRIDPARLTPGIVQSAAGSVTVTIEDLAQQTVTQWSDSNLVLDDGSAGILYTAPFTPAPGRSYRLEVKRDDGATTYAVTRTPSGPGIDTRTIVRTFANTIEQPVLLEGVSRVPDEVQVRYRVDSRFAREPVDVILDYGVAGGFERGAWRVVIRLTRDEGRIRNRLALASIDSLALHEVAIQVQLLSDDWPTGLNDPYTNVTNGFGFFGSTARFERLWRLPREAIDELGYIDRQN